MAGDPAADRQALTQVINLGLVWHCLCAITRLEVPERLAAVPQPLPELAAAVSADQDALGRVLRLVADHHIVTFGQDQVSLTDRGRLLCRDHPASLSAAFATCRDRRRRPWADQDAADRPGGRPQGAGHALLGLPGHPPRPAGAVRPGDGAASGGAVTGLCAAAGLARLRRDRRHRRRDRHPAGRGAAGRPGRPGHPGRPAPGAGARPTLPGTPRGWRPLRATSRRPVRPPPPGDLYLLASVLHDWDDPHGPASWRRWPAAPPATPGCGSSRCCFPPTPPRTGPR
jgi:hypothetical protein